MASIFGSWGSDPFAELVEKATSELLPAGQEDIALNLEICDQVRAKTVPAKQAMQTLKRRLDHKNPNVVLLALGLTDICIKNGGDHFLAEVASREFMDNLASILRRPSGVNYEVKSKALKLIQDWAQISESKPHQMGSIIDTYKSLKASGFDFPARDPKAAVSAALVETLTAPDWADGDVCMRCRTAFTTFNRKHHCRNCGNVFCQDCSSKSMSLPWYGIGQDVRVCDGCFAKKAPSASSAARKLSRSQSSITPSGRGGAGSHHRSNTLDGKRSGNRQSLRKKEDDDLALAIQLSLEASGSAPSQPAYAASSPAVKEGRPTRQADGRMLEGTDADDDPDLAAAIAASLRDYAPPAPSAPAEDGRMTPRQKDGYATQDTRLPLPPSLELPASDVDALLTFSQTSRNQELYARQHGRWQTGVGIQQQMQDEYERATAARPRMAKSLDEATRRHNVLLSMHDKLSEAVRLYDRLLDAQMNKQSYGGGMYGQQEPVHHNGYYQSNNAAAAHREYNQYNNPDAYVGRSNQERPHEQTLSPNMYPGLPSNQGQVYPNNVQAEPGYAAMQSPSVRNPSDQYRQGYFVTHQQESEQYDTGAYHAQASGPSAPALYSPDGPYTGDQGATGPRAASLGYTEQASSPYAQPSPYDQYAGTGYAAQAQWSQPAKLSSGVEGSASLQPRQSAYGATTSAQRHPSASLNEAMGSMSVHSPTTTMRNQPHSLDGAMGGGGATGYQNVEPTSYVVVNKPRQGYEAAQAIEAPNADGWPNVPIDHTNAVNATLSNAPPPPANTYQTSPVRSTYVPPYDPTTQQLPNMPSAPIASPSANDGQPHSLYQSTNNHVQAPAMVSPAQQWSRPVETPLIDL